MGNKKKKKFTQLVAVAHFLIFQMQIFLEIEVFRLENYRNIAILGSVFHTLLKLKYMGIFFFFFFFIKFFFFFFFLI